MHELVKWLLGCLGHPRVPVDRPSSNLDAVDRRLVNVEGRQREIEARLRLLERQADPRGMGRG